MAAAGAIVAVSYGRPPVEVILGASHAVVLVVLAGIDLRQRVLPNGIVLPAILVALVGAALGEGQGFGGALLGGLFAVSPFALLFLIAPPGAIGAGDVKMAALVGLMVGFPAAVEAIIAAMIAGGIAAAVVSWCQRGQAGATIPYGPFLAGGAMLTML